MPNATLTDPAEFSSLRNPLIADNRDDTIVHVKSVLSFVQALTLQEPMDGPVLPDDAASGLFYIIETCNGALESLRKPDDASEVFQAAVVRPAAPSAPRAAPTAVKDAPEFRGSIYLRDLLFADGELTAENCQLDLANAGAVRGRALDAIDMLSLHLHQVNTLLNDAQQPQPTPPSADLVDDLLWTTNQLGGLLDALRTVRTITADVQQGRAAAGGTK